MMSREGRKMAKPRTVIKREAAKNSAPSISINNHVKIRNYSKLPHLEGAIGRVVEEPTYPSTWYIVSFGDASEAYFRYPNLKLIKEDVTRMQCKDCLKWSFITTSSLRSTSAEKASRSVIDKALDDASGGIGIMSTWTCKKANKNMSAIMLCKSISLTSEAAAKSKAIVISTVYKYKNLRSTWRFNPHRREQLRSFSPPPPHPPPPTKTGATLIAPISNSHNSDSNFDRYCNFIMLISKMIIILYHCYVLKLCINFAPSFIQWKLTMTHVYYLL